MGFRVSALKGARWFLWLVMALIMVRGVASFFVQPTAVTQAADAPAPAPVVADTRPPAAFAALFAREYLTWQTGQEGERAARLAPLLSRKVDSQAGVTPGQGAAPSQVAEATWPFAVKELEAGSWLVTVAARVTTQKAEGPVARTLYLAVPVSGGDGSYVVYDYPTVVPAPPAAAAAEPGVAGDSFTDPNGAIRTLLEGFFKAYASGSGADATYFVEPGTTVRGLEGAQRFQSLVELTLRKSGEEIWAGVLVSMEDPISSVSIRQRYTVQVIERDGRWYVKQIVQKGA